MPRTGQRVFSCSSASVLCLAALSPPEAPVPTTPSQVPDAIHFRRLAGVRPLVAQPTAAGSINYPDAEVEPYVAVDPTNPEHLVASVQQDRWNDGGANGLTNVVSTGRRGDLDAGLDPARSSRICEGAAPGRLATSTGRPIHGSASRRTARSPTRSATRSTPTGRRSAERARSSSAAPPTAAIRGRRRSRRG